MLGKSLRIGRKRNVKLGFERRSRYAAPGNVARTQLDFPVPRGPNRKKLLPEGGVSILEYMIPFYIVIWSFQLQIYLTFDGPIFKWLSSDSLRVILPQEILHRDSTDLFRFKFRCGNDVQSSLWENFWKPFKLDRISKAAFDFY